MKTIKNISVKNSFTVSLLASFLFLASCKKEYISTIAPASVSTTGIARQNIVSGATQAASSEILRVSRTFTMIKIDHFAARTHAPDYCVTVKSDGSVLFEGRRHVALIGAKEWKLNTEKFHALKDMFEHSDFNRIEDRLSLLADVPMVSTTWSNSQADFSRTLIDFYHGYPEVLISLRNKAEEMLELSKYVKQSETREVSTIRIE